MLNNLKLAGKIYLGLGGITIIAFIIGVSGFFGLSNVETAVEKSNGAMMIAEHLLEGRLAVRNFSDSLDRKFLEDKNSAYNDLKKALEMMNKIFFKKEDLDKIADTTKDVEEWNNKVDEYIKQEDIKAQDDNEMVMAGREALGTIEKLQLDQREKFLKDISSSATTKVLADRGQKTVDTDLLMQYLLDLRRIEKNYIIREDKKSTEDHEKLLIKFMAICSDLKERFKDPKNDEQVDKIVKSMQEYKAAFESYVKSNELQRKIDAEMILAAKEAITQVTELKISKLEDMHKNSDNASRMIVSLVLIGVMLSLFISLTLGKSINGILVFMQSEISRLISAVEDGILNQRGDVEKTNWEFRPIIKGFNNTLDAILTPMQEAMSVMSSVAQKDLTRRIEKSYKGDLLAFKNNINAAVENLEESLTQVYSAGSQIEAGALQVSQASQALSQGATESAASLEEITSSMNEISTQTGLNAENATKAKNFSLEARNNANAGNEKMQVMVSAMVDINSSSQNIAKIIKVIDAIAFQTNLLALNAAVEAARAGKHGKGFAVVAEEVRNLAARSAKAASETTELIEDSTKKVESGSKIAMDTAAALEEIVKRIGEVTEIVGNITEASNEQAQAMNQINSALGQVDTVTQRNTASSEESASAAEELSSQAVELNSMVAQFKLRARASKI